MYSTCLFCSGALGRNEAIEHFPVGRRLAFDAAKGRLWVVCKSCARWNLTPLESRWEAIEEAERAYRTGTERMATGEIGLVRLTEGTDLIRVGAPLRSEFATWRYGHVFKRRLRKAYIAMAAGTAAPWFMMYVQGSSLFGFPAFGSLLSPGTLSLASAAMSVALPLVQFRNERAKRVKMRAPAGPLLRIPLLDARAAQIVVNTQDQSWALRVKHKLPRRGGRLWASFSEGRQVSEDDRWTQMEGNDAHRALRIILPSVNRDGATAEEVNMAVQIMGESPDPMERIARGALPSRRGRAAEANITALGELSTDFRLALEMSVHELDERRALEGELGELEARWKEAEEIAAIADNMFLPADVTDRVSLFKRGER